MSSDQAPPFVGFHANGVVYRSQDGKKETLVRLVYASEEIRDVIVTALRRYVEESNPKGGLMEKGIVKLFCPWCGKRHVDEGEFAERPHHTHRCVDDAWGTGCKQEWRLAEYVFGSRPNEVERTAVDEALALIESTRGRYDVDGVLKREGAAVLVAKELRQLRTELVRHRTLEPYLEDVLICHRTHAGDDRALSQAVETLLQATAAVGV